MPGSGVDQMLVGFLPNLRRFAISLCGSRDLADDLVQAACERALRNASSYAAGTRFDAWMFQILRNLWIDHLRRTRTAGIHDDIDAHHDLPEASGESAVESRLALKSVSDAVLALAPEQREVLLLVCVEDLSYRETADVLQIPIGTVMSRLSRARRAIAEATGISGADPRSSREESRKQ